MCTLNIDGSQFLTIVKLDTFCAVNKIQTSVPVAIVAVTVFDDFGTDIGPLPATIVDDDTILLDLFPLAENYCLYIYNLMANDRKCRRYHCIEAFYANGTTEILAMTVNCVLQDVIKTTKFKLVIVDDIVEPCNMSKCTHVYRFNDDHIFRIERFHYKNVKLCII